MGYSFGISDEFNPAPKGAELFKTKTELEKAEKVVAKEVDEANIAFLDEAHSVAIEAIDSKVWSTADTVAAMKQEAKARGLSGYSKLKEADLIKLLNGTK